MVSDHTEYLCSNIKPRYIPISVCRSISDETSEHIFPLDKLGCVGISGNWNKYKSVGCEWIK